MKKAFNSTNKKRILFVTHTKSRCGVYEFGKNLVNVLKKSDAFELIWSECGSLEDLRTAYAEFCPDAIIYNYHPAVLPWIVTKPAPGLAPRLYKNNIASIPVPQIGLLHEVTQEIADTAVNYKTRLLFGGKKILNSLFDFYIVPDPTLLLKNPCVFKTGRFIPQYSVRNQQQGDRVIVGSFGFGSPSKGFEKIVDLVQKEFDAALIRFNIPAADFCDKDGENARKIADNCRKLLEKPGIELQITHDFLGDDELLDFLAGNSINVFCYEDSANRGISSATDYAIAAGRPIAVSNSSMFRHIIRALPGVCLSNSRLKSIFEGGFAPLEKLRSEWTQANLVWDYERILAAVFRKSGHAKQAANSLGGRFLDCCYRLLSEPDRKFSWLGKRQKFVEDDLSPVPGRFYEPVDLPAGMSLNGILDDRAREIFKPAVDLMNELVPGAMALKISEANVQQAFVLDTVCRFIRRFSNPRILCVGSNGDTAAMTLKKLGYKIDEIDPTYDYFLQEFVTKPSTLEESYDIIFSTSVIEHDPDDESFVRCLRTLLKKGGVTILTCDFKNGWKAGDPKPFCDERFYTEFDLKNRLLEHMPGCRLFDEPDWSCDNPDFTYQGIKYTFASFVAEKIK